MLGLILVAVSQVFAEFAASFGKREVERKEETVYEMAFLSTVWGAVLISLWGVFHGSFVFNPESLPLFLVRSVLEIALLFISFHAVIRADRSTFAFLRVLTIPAVLAADIVLGYTLSLTQILGMLLIVTSLGLLFFGKGLSATGKLLTITAALLAAATVSLFKYNLTYYGNSVEAEESIMYAILLVAVIAAGFFRGHQNVFASFLRPAHLAQSFAAGIGSILMAFAYVFAPASVIMSGKRALDILYAIVSGQTYFHENRLALKLLAFLVVATGVGLVAFGAL